VLPRSGIYLNMSVRERNSSRYLQW